MSIRTFDRRFAANTRRVVQVCVIALLWAIGLATDTFAQSLDTGWKTETRLYLSGVSNYWQENGVSSSYEYLATSAELRFTSDAKPWSASLFADYRFSTSSRFTDQVNLGALFKYQYYKWDATAYLFVNQTAKSPDTWLYAGRVRYRIAENHNLGIEATGSFKYPDSLQLMLGYYGEISDSVSLNIAAGPVAGKGRDFNARLELIWQVL